MKSFKFSKFTTNKYVKINIDTNGYNFEIPLQSIMMMMIIKDNRI